MLNTSKADSEVAQEFAQVEVERFQRELSEKNDLIETLNTNLAVCVLDYILSK